MPLSSSEDSSSSNLSVIHDDELYGVTELREVLIGAKIGLNKLLVELDHLHEILGDLTIPALNTFRTDVAKMIHRVGRLFKKLQIVVNENDMRDMHAFAETRAKTRVVDSAVQLAVELEKMNVKSSQLVYQLNVFKLY